MYCPLPTIPDDLETLRSSLSAMREAVEGFIRAYSPQQLASLTGYPYLCNIDLH